MVKKEQVKISNSDEENKFNFPQDSHGRRFKLSYYNRQLHNGEIAQRSWLITPIKTIQCFAFVVSFFQLFKLL